MSLIWRFPMPPLSLKREIILIVLLVFAVYANALLWGVFQFDDYNVIVYDKTVHSWRAWWSNLGHGIRPLLKLSYTADWLSGRGESGFHLTNLLIHSANTIFVLLLTRRFALCHVRLQPNACSIALVTALLFAVHPIHTEAVTYISGRSSSLMALCYMGALLAYFAGRDGLLGEGSRKKLPVLLLYFAVPLLFMMAVAVKETAILFPVALMLLERGCGTCPLSSPWQFVRLQWPVWLTFLVLLACLTMYGNYPSHAGRSLALHGGWVNLITQAHGFIYLMGQWFWPVDLNIDPDLPVFTRINAAAMLKMLLMFFLVVWAVSGFFRPVKQGERSWLWFAFAWAILHVTMLYLFLPRLDVANERQLYVASWPMLMAIASEMALVFSKRLMLPFFTILIISGSALTFLRNQNYYSEISLWESTLVLSPNKSRVHNNLGYAYLLAGRDAEAQRHFMQAVQLDSENYRARFNLQRVK